MAGKLQYTEIYTLIGLSGNPLPVEATVEYYQLGPERWVIMTIPEFTQNNITFNEFKFEGEPSFTVDNKVLFQEALIVVNDTFTQVVSTPPSFQLKSSTKPLTPVTQPTPQQVNEQTQKETDQKANEQTLTNTTKPNTQVAEQNTPPTLTPTGRDKFAILLNKKRSIIKKTLVPLVLGLAVKAGIKNIGTPKVQFPDYCQSPEELQKMIILRNQVVNRLNQIVKTIDIFSTLLTGFGIVISLVLTAKEISRKTKNTLSNIIKISPSAPGAATSLLNDLSDIIDKLNTKYVALAGIIASVNLSLSLLRNVLLNIIRMLKDLDKYLSKCDSNANLIPLDNNLLVLEQIDTLVEETPNKNTYNGFILEIIEEPFSPTVSRRRAVAKNTQGIILLSTPLSFTTLPEILIEEIKLIIDSNNLKAD